jgi:type I restriction enzyme S subunit
MIDGLRPYPEMKPSGVPWLGAVPADWDVRRIKTLLKEIDHRTKSGDERLLSLRMRRGLVDHHDSGGKPILREALVGFKVIEPGQIVMNRMRAAYGLFGLADVRGLVSPDYAVFQPADHSYGRYLLETFKLPSLALVFRAESKGLGTGESGFLRLYTDRFGPIPVPYPPLDEQRLIVRFLDWHGVQTAKLVRAKKKIIALLNEQKQAIIHRAVTRGLDPHAKLKPSGIPWLGDVPEGWEVRKLATLFRVIGSGTTPSGPVYYEAGSIPWVMSGDLNNGKIQSTKRTVTDFAVKEVSALRIYPKNSLIVAMYGATIGKTGVLAVEACTNQACCVLASPRSTVNVHYVQMFVNLAKSALVEQAYGGGQPNINAEVVKALRIPVPPIEQQEEILSRIKSGHEDTAILNAHREIALIQEFRTRLIADVVTGKLDVRVAAASLPDATEIEPIDDLAEVDDLDEVLDDAENEEVAA